MPQQVEVTLRFYEAVGVEMQGWSCRTEGTYWTECKMQLEAIAAPEPTSGLLLGVLLLAGLVRRRTKRGT